MSDSKLILLCGLWQQTSSKGVQYLKGKTNRPILVEPGYTLLVFPNNRRTKDNQPQFYIYSSPPDGQGKAGDNGAHKEGEAKNYKVGAPPEQGKTGGSDDVPF